MCYNNSAKWWIRSFAIRVLMDAHLCDALSAHFFLFNEVLLMAGWKDIPNQIRNVHGKGMDINPIDTTVDIFQRKNYYTLINAYKKLFSIPGSSPTTYISGISIKEVFSIYNFDFDLRLLYLKNILEIEAELRTHIAYEFGKLYTGAGWTDTSSFDASNPYVSQLINDLNDVVSKGIRKNKEMITHFTTRGKIVPIWVLIENLEFGTLRSFYNCLNQSLRETIARTYYNLSESVLKNFIAYLNEIRNVCAHDNRLLFFCCKYKINNMPLHHNLGIALNSSGSYIRGKKDCFTLLIIMKYLLTEKDFKESFYQIKQLFVKLKRNLKTISLKDVLDSLGYPDHTNSHKGWKGILSALK